MEVFIASAVQWLLHTLALPEVGLSAIFLIALISATLLPLGSEPAVFGYVKLAPDMFWTAVVVATIGNTVGGIISYYMGLGAYKSFHHWREHHPKIKPHESDASQPSTDMVKLNEKQQEQLGGKWFSKLSVFLDRYGPVTLLLSWLPVVGDPLCAVAGWLRFKLLPCIIFMAIGKFIRYVLMTAALLYVF